MVKGVEGTLEAEALLLLLMPHSSFWVDSLGGHILKSWHQTVAIGKECNSIEQSRLQESSQWDRKNWIESDFEAWKMELRD